MRKSLKMDWVKVAAKGEPSTKVLTKKEKAIQRGQKTTEGQKCSSVDTANNQNNT
jgi:hypothetical protein